MALETASFISGLQSANPTTADPVRQGDDHIRLIKGALKNTFPNINAAVTATPAELNKLAGLATTQAELTKLNGVTASAAELNLLDGVTASTAELNKVDGLTASTAELNKLDGATASTAELNNVTGTTGPIQSQINAVETFAVTAVPPGAIFFFAFPSTPTGYLQADGAAISRTTYANLFAAIGTTFGVGDGSTTFNLPDLRGEFARGWDDARGVDAGRSFGSWQADEFKAHSHSQIYYRGGQTDSAGGSNDADTLQTTQTGETGGDETRPRNVALLACIKT